MMGVMDDRGRTSEYETATDQPRRDHIECGPTALPKIEQIAMWTVEAMQSISPQIVQNSWHDRRFGWFPEELNDKIKIMTT